MGLTTLIHNCCVYVRWTCCWDGVFGLVGEVEMGMRVGELAGLDPVLFTAAIS